MPSSRPLPFYDGEHYDVSTSVGHQLWNLMTLMRREVDLRMTQVGLTDAQWRPLWLLFNHTADTANELARLMDMDAGAVTRLIDRLEAKGLIERERSDVDRRVVHLRLTATGREASARIPHVLAAVNNDMLAGFSDAEWHTLRQSLERMAANGQRLATAQEAAA